MVTPRLMPPPAIHIVNARGWWSRPSSFEPFRASLIGVRPNSPPQTTSVVSSSPRAVIELHEPHAALDQPARQQAVVRERHLSRVGAVHLVNPRRLAGDIGELWHA